MTKRTIIVIVLILLVLLFLKGCYYNQYNNLVNQVAKLKEGEIAFRMQRLKDSSTIVSQEAIILTKDEAIKLGYGKIQSQVVTKTRVVIDSIFIPYPTNYVDTTGWAFKFKNGDTSKAIIDSLIANSLIVPADWQKSTKWLSISGKVKKEGVLIDTIIIPNETSVTIGYKKSGFLNLGRKEMVDVRNTNPYLNTDGMRNVVIKPNKSLLNNKIFWMGIGILGGIFIQSKL